MTKQIFPFYFLLQERAKPILPLTLRPPIRPYLRQEPLGSIKSLVLLSLRPFLRPPIRP